MNLMRNIVATVVVLALAGLGLADVILIDDFNDGEVVIVDVVPTHPDFEEIYDEQGAPEDPGMLDDVKGGVRGWGVTKANKGVGTDLTVSVYLNDDEYTYGLWEVVHEGNPEAGSMIYVQYGGLCDTGWHWHEDWNDYDRFRFYVEDYDVVEGDDIQYFLKVMTGPDGSETFYRVYGSVEPEIGWHEIMFENLLDDDNNSLIDDLDNVDGLKFAIEAGQDSEDRERVFVGRLEVIPEPATLSLLGLGAVGLLLRRRKQAS